MTGSLRRNLGKTGIECSPIGMGCWVVGGPLYDGDTPALAASGFGNACDQEGRQITVQDPGVLELSPSSAGHMREVSALLHAR